MKTNELMKKIRYVKYALGFVLICTVLFTINSCLRAHAKTTTYEAVSYPTDPSDFVFFPKTAYEVPHDVPTAADSTQTALSIFAWQEFIALNWPSTYSKDAKRGLPDTQAGVTGFLNASNTGELVWHTYKHRVEVYPKLKFKSPQEAKKYDISFESSFDAAPKYQYAQTINPLDPKSKIPLNEITVFNNLDEASEINLCTLFVNPDPDEPGAKKENADKIASGLPGAPRRMIYEAKVNRAMFDYVVSKDLQDTLNRAARIKFTENAIKNDGTGATYLNKEQQQKYSKQIVFPFGDNATKEEGSIEIKATWRQLTLNEYKSGRFLTAPIIRYRGGTIENPQKYKDARYQVVEGSPQYDDKGNLTSLPYGLVGLHIIHKTKTFPSYVFATFEQVDNLSDGYNPVTMKRDIKNELFYYNRQKNPLIHYERKNVFTRENPIMDDTQKVNDAVHAQIKKLNNSSVWQYYKLIGVQGHPAPNDNSTDYYLSNIATETNDILANFSGTLNNKTGVKDPNGINVYQRNKKIVQGGCKGCHGNAQQADFSFITLDAPITVVDFINQPLLRKDSIQ